MRLRSAAGSVSAGSDARMTSGAVTPKSESVSRLSGSRRVILSTQSLMTRAASFRSRSYTIGPMPQPYICTLQPQRCARRMALR